MAHRDDVAALEASTPWTRAGFRHGLSLLSASTASAARMFAADAATWRVWPPRSRAAAATSPAVPAETGLGLSNEPGWLDAPTTRQLLVDAELRRACADSTTGQLVDHDPRDRRPPPTPTGLRTALLELISGDLTLTGTPSDVAWRTEPQHDPSDAMRAFTALRDRTCDGPTRSTTSAARCDLDHDPPHPTGSTAAWNLASRARRTHQLTHHG